jgi:DNA-binding MarR family transcriptional regulator
MDMKTVANEIADGCYALRSRRLARAVTRTYDDHLRPHGLTVSQLTVLTMVGLDVDRPVDIGRRLDMEKSTVSRALQLMADRGWIAIEPDGAGKRVRLTPAGEDLVAASADAWRAATADVAERLDRHGLLPVLTPRPATHPSAKESP